VKLPPRTLGQQGDLDLVEQRRQRAQRRDYPPGSEHRDTLGHQLAQGSCAPCTHSIGMTVTLSAWLMTAASQ